MLPHSMLPKCSFADCCCPCCSKGSASPGTHWVQVEGIWALSPNVVPALGQGVLSGRGCGGHELQQPYQQLYCQLLAVGAPPALAPVVLPAARSAAIAAVLAAAAHGRHLAQPQYPLPAQGIIPLPCDDAMVLDLCLDDLQALAKDVVEVASEATEQRVVALEVARADEQGAHWVHTFSGSRCVGSAVCTSMEQPSQHASEQQDWFRCSRVYGPESSTRSPHDAPLHHLRVSVMQ